MRLASLAFSAALAAIVAIPAADIVISGFNTAARQLESVAKARRISATYLIGHCQGRVLLRREEDQFPPNCDKIERSY